MSAAARRELERGPCPEFQTLHCHDVRSTVKGVARRHLNHERFTLALISVRLVPVPQSGCGNDRDAIR